MIRRLLPVVTLALSTANLSAQSFNLDFGEAANTPSPSYAAAGLPGYWNGLRADSWLTYNLLDLSGNPTNVTFSQAGAAGVITASDPSVTGDDSLLMNDGIITYTFGVDSCFYFNGLEPGTYELITYAWRPNFPTEMAKTFVDNTVGVEISGGAWPGSQVHGVTYARHIVTVDASGFMGPHSGLDAGADQPTGAVCNGMQLRKLDDFTEYCFGDGTGSACPCGNNGLPGNGCENSSSTGGAHASASGTTSPDTIVLNVTGEKPTALSVFLQGTTSISTLNYGDGLRCVGGTFKRLYARNASAGQVSAPHAGDPSITTRSAALGDPIPSGATRYYMISYRDPSPSFCPSPMGGTFNTTNAVSITW
jgi:hypothetical protein